MGCCLSSQVYVFFSELYTYLNAFLITNHFGRMLKYWTAKLRMLQQSGREFIA